MGGVNIIVETRNCVSLLLRIILNYPRNCNKFAAGKSIIISYGSAMRYYRYNKCWKDNYF